MDLSPCHTIALLCLARDEIEWIKAMRREQPEVRPLIFSPWKWAEVLNFVVIPFLMSAPVPSNT